MTTPLTVELFIIGNELLIGEIQDTNTHWLCRELNALGGQVVRATLLRDTAPVIADEIRAALVRAPRVIITSGGLGPTADDLTLEALAQGLDRKLAPHDAALMMIRDRYDELAAQGSLSQGGLNPAREKMAWFPAGAHPLHNPVGTAPAVMIESGSTTIICLPGVPSELKGIFTTSLQPFLRTTFKSGLSLLRTITVQCNDESLMEPVLSRVANDHPAVYIKSLAATIDENSELDITLNATGQDEAALAPLLQAAMADLKAGLTALGIDHRDKANR
ncbi:MAG: molybdopterin-binding protein [Geobacteraceae bacterium GWC2_53_11]|nr:MAG: molybdopterin-binding protein [Geobacteraceae bacterium GWC2_53_11]